MSSAFLRPYSNLYTKHTLPHKQITSRSKILHISALPAPEKGEIHNGCESIDEFQDESLEDKPLFKALVSLWNL